MYTFTTESNHESKREKDINKNSANGLQKRFVQ